MTPAPTYAITAIGNAIMDVLAHVKPHVVSHAGLTPGSMTLIDEATAEQSINVLDNPRLCSGESAANTLAAIAQLGARCAFIGKVKADELGHAYASDLERLGIHFSTPQATSGASTARCVIMVTPDGERTMATYLGACLGLTLSDMDEAVIRASAMLYVEGYLWDGDVVKSAINHALQLAEKHSVKTAFTLSDTFCVARHRSDFLALAKRVDVLFANEAEACALFEVNTRDEALQRLASHTKRAFVTCSGDGAYAIDAGTITHVATTPVFKVVDTTGAGDCFAAGVLYALSQGRSPVDAATLGNSLAGQIIQQLGSRSEAGFKLI